MLLPDEKQKQTRHIFPVTLSGSRQRYAVRCPGRSSYLAHTFQEAILAAQLLNLADPPPCAGRFDATGPHDEACKGVASVHQQRTKGTYPSLPGHTNGYCTPCAKRLWMPPWDS